jgi:hypothetical protein
VSCRSLARFRSAGEPSIDDSSTSLSSSRTSRREKNEERLAGQSAKLRSDVRDGVVQKQYPCATQ